MPSSRRAAARCIKLVAAERDLVLWESALRQQIYLGSEAYVARLRQQALPARRGSADVRRAQRQPVRQGAPQDALGRDRRLGADGELPGGAGRDRKSSELSTPRRLGCNGAAHDPKQPTSITCN